MDYRSLFLFSGEPWLIQGYVFGLEKAMATHSSTLAWKIPWVEEPGRLQSMGLPRWTRLSDFTFTFHFHALENAMATHSSVLAWRIPGMGEPGGLPSMGSHRVGHDWSNLAAAAACIWPIREGHLIWNHIKVVCICGFKLPCFATLTFSKGYICICSKVPLKVLLCMHAKSL